MDYGFTHHGKVYTPNATQGISADENSARNAEMEALELADWAKAPDRMLAYYHFPAEHVPLYGTSSHAARQSFHPCLHTYINQAKPGDPGVDHCAYVSTWPGTRIGTITAARVYRHNFGGRFVALRVRGTNGADYYGRASWDWGQCVMLRKVKGGK